MKGILVDSNILLDLFQNDPVWAEWSESILEHYATKGALYINFVIYTEISIGFQKIEDLESILHECGIEILQVPKEALFLAGKAFLTYRKSKGNKRSPLPDFFIGAHAAVSGMPLITRDVSRYRTYFPTVELIFP